MLDSVNLVQFNKAFRGSLSDMLVITETCVEKNTQVLNDRHRCYFLPFYSNILELSKSYNLPDFGPNNLDKTKISRYTEI